MARWDHPEDYERLYQLDSGAAWAWEFLRRNPGYIHDYEVACHAQKTYLTNKPQNPLDQYSEFPGAYFLPTKDKGESIKEWLERCREKVPRRVSPLRYYGEMWGLSHDMIDPDTDLPQNLRFRAACEYPCLLDKGTDASPYFHPEDFGQIRKSRFATVVFDLGMSLNAQLEALKPILEAQHAKFMEDSVLIKGKRLVVGGLVDVVRAWDANCQVGDSWSPKEIADSLFPVTRSDIDYPKQTYIDDLGRAKNFVNNYELLLRFAPETHDVKKRKKSNKTKG